MSTTARIGLGAAILCAGAGAFVWSSRASALVQARALAADDLASFERCLYGEPLGPNDTLAGRMRGIELANALAHDSDPAADADNADAGASDAGKPDATVWPASCAPLAEALGKVLDSEALGRDRSLDALRDALPSRRRLELPFALQSDEAAELTAAIAKANLVSHKDAGDVGISAPAFLAPPLSAKDLAPLGKGKLADSDALSTSTVRLVLRDAKARLCTVDADDAASGNKPVRCGDLDLVHASLINEDEGAPTALLIQKARARKPDDDYRLTDRSEGIIFIGSPKAIPINYTNGWHTVTDAFLAKDGGYMILGYAPLVRVGTIEKLQTTDVGEAALDTEAVHAGVAPGQTVAAYGYVFFNDQAPIYKDYDPDRRFWARQVLPTLSAKAVDLGLATSNSLDLRFGCKRDGRVAVVFAIDPAYAKDPKQKSVRVAISEGDGPLHAFDAQIGDSSPHVTCTHDAAVITSIAGVDKDTSRVVVVESRCNATGCTTKRSEPVLVAGAGTVSAATTDTGVLFVWNLRADRVLSRAHGMAFYRFAPLDKLAADAPRPLFDNHRNGGLDVDAFELVSRNVGSLALLQTGGKTPSTYAVRFDAAGAASPVRVEETKW